MWWWFSEEDGISFSYKDKLRVLKGKRGKRREDKLRVLDLLVSRSCHGEKKEKRELGVPFI